MTAVLELFSGANTSDIAGRIPDGGGSLALQHGVWANRTPDFDAVAITGNKAVQSFANSWSGGFVDTIPGWVANGFASVRGRFTTANANMQFGVSMRWAASGYTGMLMTMYGDGYIVLEVDIDPGFPSPYLIGSWDTGAPSLNTDYVLGLCADGVVIRLFKNNALVGCTADARILGAGSPGLFLGGGGGAPGDVSIDRFEAGPGCGSAIPVDPGGGASVLSVRSNLVFRPALKLYVRKNLAWRDITTVSQQKHKGWRPLSSIGGSFGDGDPSDACGAPRLGHPIYSLFGNHQETIYYKNDSYFAIYGPDKAARAASVIRSMPAAELASAAAIYNGGIMCAAYSPHPIYYSVLLVPGTLGSGVNIVHLPDDSYETTGGAIHTPIDPLNPTWVNAPAPTVTGFATPSAPYGIAVGTRWRKLITGTVYLSPCIQLGDWALYYWRQTSAEGPPTQVIFNHQFWRLTGDSGGTSTPTWWYLHYGSFCDPSPSNGASATFASDNSGPYPKAPGGIPDPIGVRTYVCNYLGIRRSFYGGHGHVAIRYGVVYSDDNGCGLVAQDWLNNTISDIQDCGVNTTTDDNPTPSTSFANINYWEDQQRIWVTQAGGGALWGYRIGYTLDQTWATGLSGGRGVCTDNQGNPFVVGLGGVVKLDREDGTIIWSQSETNCHMIKWFSDGGVITPGSGYVLVTDVANGRVVKFNAITGAFMAATTVGSSPHDFIIVRGKIWVANTGSDTVSVLNLSSLALERTIPTRAQPWGLCFDGDNQYYGGQDVVWVGHISGEKLLAIA